MNGETDFLRHALATLAYRCQRAVDGAPSDFGQFRAAPRTRTPSEILAHMADLFDWALALADGRRFWRDSAPLEWGAGIARFFAVLETFDRRVAADAPLACPAEKLFQGPVADALTHTGQLAMLRHMADCKIRGENYFVASIQAGVVGMDQPAPSREFD